MGRSRIRWPRFLLSLSLLGLLLALLVSRLTGPGGADPDPDPAPADQQPPVVAPGPRGAPDELGMVPILVYHAIGDTEERWQRQRENFAADLVRFHAEGYRLVSLGDYVDGRIDIPAGYSPLVLTFDDSTAGQFRLLDSADGPVVDPESALGILLDFHREHPDFGLEATFFINFPHPFGQPDSWQQQLALLLELGLDVGNHTWSHADLAAIPAEAARRELGQPVQALAQIDPSYRMDMLAPPYGSLPDDPAHILAGRWGDVDYSHRGVVLAGGNPAPSPHSRDFDPTRIARIQATQEQLDLWFARLAEPGAAYVADGCPDTITIPAGRLEQLCPAAAARFEVVTREP